MKNKEVARIKWLETSLLLVVGVLIYMASDDITSRSETDLSGEWLMIISGILIYAGVLLQWWTGRKKKKGWWLFR